MSGRRALPSSRIAGAGCLKVEREDRQNANQAAAADHDNLEEGRPRYDNTDNDPKDAYLFALKPRLDFGSFRNLQGQTRSDLRH